ncbi:MAG: acyltransferase [Hellea sp.]|nr:acyltransferase [Hellea sp.]
MGIAPKQNSVPAKEHVYFGALDGFRGLLAVFVAIYHTYWPSLTNGSAFFENGPVIIDLFFVFSGFLLFTLYANRINSPDQAGAFLKKRFARLYPLHLFILILFVMFALLRLVFHMSGIAHDDPGEILPFEPGATESVGALISNIFLTHSMGLHGSLSYNVPSWTVSVEFFAYFTFAAMLLWAPPKKGWHFGLIGVGVVAIYAYLAQIKPDMNITYDFGFLRCMAGFYTGIIAAYLYSKCRKLNFVMNMNFNMATIIEAVTLLSSTLFVIYCPGKLQFFVGPVILAFVLVFSFDKGMVSKFMMGRVFRYLAKVSYSVYMVHMLIAVLYYALISKFIANPEWFGAGINGDLMLLPYLAIVLIFSHFTQKYVEIGGQKWIMSRRFGRITKDVSALSKS